MQVGTKFISFYLGVLVLVVVCHGENILLKKNNNMINMADREFDYHKLTKRRDLDPQTCNFDIHRDKNIRTEVSMEMGAKYLKEIVLGSRDECLRLCCETDNCDLFVFEEKNPGSCYLFHCGPPEDFKCKFMRFTNFSSAVLMVNRHLAELEDRIKYTKLEQDLASWRKQVQIQDPPSTLKPVTIRPIISNNQPETSPPPVSRRCSRFQFECHSSEECIAIYNACDGIPQCADGSDEAPELGCPGTTTLPPGPNLPPREILPQIPQTQQVPVYSGAETIPKDNQQNQHQQAFMRPVGNIEGPPWPRQLDSSVTNNMAQHIKQFNENSFPSHIFNHKGGLQVTETDNAQPSQYEYKALPYDSMPENNNWMHRQWPQQQDHININDGSPIYHNMEMDPPNSWKQQTMQNMPIQPRLQNINNQIQPSRIMGAADKIMMPEMPDNNRNNMYQLRDKSWPVHLMPNIQQENPQVYQQTDKVLPPIVENKNVQSQNTNNQKTLQITDKTKVEPIPDKNDDTENDSDDASDENADDDGKKHKHNDGKSSKKTGANKTKKHLKEDKDEDSEKKAVEKSNDNKDMPIHGREEQSIQGREFPEDVNDGAAENPPGAILLLTLGICITSIMVVVIGCRLKMAKKRTRRSGKTPFVQDADYMVNGIKTHIIYKIPIDNGFRVT